MTIVFFAVIVVPIWWKDGVGKNSVLFGHVSEPIVLHGGRTGWGGVVLLSHTYQSLLLPFDTPFGGRKVFSLLVLRTWDILAKIRIRGSVPLNYGSRFGSRSGLYRTILTLLSVEERCSFS